jgi:transglutaminase-like putative cysteine protease
MAKIVISMIFLFIFSGLSEKYPLEVQIYLRPTKYINSNHPEIIEKAAELTQNSKTNAEKARILFEFVRDSYNDNKSGSFKASDILDYGGNNCIRRSILLAALCRAVRIPARLHIQEFTIRDYRFRNGIIKDFRSPHVITGIYLNGNWHLYEATGNKKKWVSMNQDEKYASEMPVPFFPDRDCVFKSNDKIIFKRSLIYFTDWSEEIEALKNKIYTGEVGFFPSPSGGKK